MNPLPIQMKDDESFRLRIGTLQTVAATADYPDRSEAASAQRGWARVSLTDRLKVVRRFRHLLALHGAELAHTGALARRVPASEVMASEVLPLADACRWLEQHAVRLLGPTRPRGKRPWWLPAHQVEVRREPHGLILILGPSNYPFFLPGVQMMQALVAGNAVWLKPGRRGGEPACALASLLRHAGLDPRLLQVLPESVQSGQQALALGPDKVVLTGSAQTGRTVLSELAPRLVPAAMELSGSDPVVVRADADLDLVTRALCFGLTLNAGATCIAPRRVLLAREVATELEGRLAASLASCPTIPVRQAVAGRLRLALEQALSQGAHLVAGRVEDSGRLSGPLVLAGLVRNSPLLREDWFAPVLFLMVANNDQDAVTLAGQCPYALGASIFTRDLEQARRMAGDIPAGMVTINDLIAPTADPRLAFGGRRKSGFGRTRGAEGLLEMTVSKTLVQSRARLHPHLDPPAPGDLDLFGALLECRHGASWKDRIRAALRLVRAGLNRNRTTPSSHPKQTHEQS